jgi:hypothetical protein
VTTVTRGSFIRQLAELTDLDADSDDLAAVHQKLAAAVGVGLYSPRILAAARKLASLRIHSDRYRAAFDRAIDEGRALPSQRPLIQPYFVHDPEGAIRLVDGLKPVRNVTSRRAPDGVYPRSVDLDRRIEAYAVEQGCGYTEAFERVVETA